MQPTFTIGIEEEYQTVDPVTRDLRSHIHAEILEKGKMILQERVKAEMHQSVVEVGTSVCSNIKEARDEVKKLRRNMVRLAKENGLRLASAATHPFGDWRAQEIHPDERYKNIVEDLQLVARANLIFGLHVHIGIEDRETAIHAARYGLDGKLIDFGKQKEVPARDLVREYLDFVDDVVDELDSREELNYIHQIVEGGSGADRRLRVFQETGDLKKVVDYIIEETEAGLAETEEPAAVQKTGS